jgi:hypothetical protein
VGLKKLSERFDERLARSPILVLLGGDPRFGILVSLLDEYQAETEERLQRVQREAETAKPFYEQGCGR